jgi:peptidoglycan hydrolase CwlO-like protein
MASLKIVGILASIVAVISALVGITMFVSNTNSVATEAYARSIRNGSRIEHSIDKTNSDISDIKNDIASIQRDIGQILGELKNVCAKNSHDERRR